MTHSRFFATLLGVTLLGGLAVGGSLAAQMQDQPDYQPAIATDDVEQGGYAYVSALEGAATLTPVGGARQALEINQPLAAGDHLRVDRGARAEIVLPEGGVARLGGESMLAFAQVDAMDGGGQNALRLDDGSLQVVVGANGGGDRGGPVRVDTTNATAYFDRDGRYLVETDPSAGWTRVVVREGSCELMTENGSRGLQAGDEAEVQGAYAPRVIVADAGSWSQLEVWGRSLDEQAARAASRYVDPSLRYASTQLAYNGSWATVDGQVAWRPRVDESWRPYTDGRWASTASGLTWVSAEPWGWVTSHYGSWDYRPSYGWVWFPGARYSPAWVYWYWGPSHVGWCPTGYYTHYYGASYFGAGVRAGVYGWAGGWGGFLDWNFVPVGYVGARGLSRYCRRGYDLRNELRADGLPRGIITTDTRGSQRWTRPDDILRDWQGSGRRTRPGDAAGGLPDVSTFISRRRDLDPAVRNQIATVGGEPVLGSGRDRGAIRPQPWARQRPVERGGYDTSRTRVTSMPAPRTSNDDASGGRVAPLPADRGPRSGDAVRQMPAEGDWRRSNSASAGRPEVGSMPASDANADWRRQPSMRDRGGASSGDADLRTSRGARSSGNGAGPWDLRAVDPRRPMPQGGSRAPARESERRRPEPPVDDARARARTPSEDRGVYRGGDNEAPPIRRIVEGVRQTPPPQQDASPRRVEPTPPSRSNDRSASQGQSSRSNRGGDRGRRESSSRDRSGSEDGGAPPPGGG